MFNPNQLIMPEILVVTDLEFVGDGLVIHTNVTSTSARSPSCQSPSRRLHSHYTRTLADLPWAGMPVRLRVGVRRFRCANTDCPQRIFAERLGEVAPAYARRTTRQHELLLLIALSVGGEAGARLAAELACGVSPDTLLRVIRRTPDPLYAPPAVLGVDDWAWRKRHRYGTILVDLELHRVIDLLPDRSAASFARWLQAHPEVQIISRDREAKRRLAHEKMVQRYETIQAMKAQGLSQRAIARTLGMHRQTVRRYYEAETVPERARRASREGILTPYEGHIRERWRQGERNGMALWREIVAQGYPGTRRNVSRLVAHLRRQEQSGDEKAEPAQGLTPGQALGLLLMRPEARSTKEEAAIRHLKILDPQIERSIGLLDRFRKLIRARSREDLECWMRAAARSGVSELVEFERKLRQDREAVEAGCTLEWSQGQVEGQITKLKLIRRQMYGRGNFDLVRKRVLCAA